jgi:outer membrane protein assembly factor BamB
MASRRRLLRVALTPGLLLAVLAGTLLAEDRPDLWPQWRGPTRDGHASGRPWPADLASLKSLWRVELGPGYSGPVVAADRVFVTESREEKYEVVRALERKTGKELWKAQWKGAVTVPSYARAHGTWIRSTPAYDDTAGDSGGGRRLYVAGMRDLLVCLDADTGKELWRVDFVERYGTPVPPYGFVSSPLVGADAVYVQAAAALVKLDKKTGKVLWRVLPYKSSPNGTAVSSPVLANLAGRPQLLVQHPRKLYGVDPGPGKVLWSAEVSAFRGINILTPTAYDSGVLTSAFGGRTFFFEVRRHKEGLEATRAWVNSAQGYMSSPVVVGRYAYLHLRNQRFACLDLQTGKTRWTTTRVFGKYWSLVTQGDKILALDQRGTLYLIRANSDKFELLASRKISDEETWGHLSVCGGGLFVRELHAVAAYEWGHPGP